MNEVDKLKILISKNVDSKITYSGKSFKGSYHTIEVDGQVIPGQRDLNYRISKIGEHLRGKSVMDLGCNQGGMLLELRDIISWGVGVDHNSGLINAANKTAEMLNVNNLSFYTYDLVSDLYTSLPCFFRRSNTVDVVFMFAIARWVCNWEQILDYMKSYTKEVFFEAHGNPQEITAQKNGLVRVFSEVEDFGPISDDGNLRRMYRCEV